MEKRNKNIKARIALITVDEYLKMLPDDAHNALQRLRNIIKSVVPDAKERISYMVPIISLNRDLVGFSSQKNHCSFYTMSPALVKRMEKELRNYKVSGATIHFKPDEPLPESLIKKIVKERIRESGRK